MDWLELRYFGNSVKSYLSAAATFSLIVFGFALAHRLVLGRLRTWASRTVTQLDDLVVELLQMIRTPEQYLVGFYLATRPLHLPAWLDKGFRAAVVLAVSYRAVTMIQRLAAFAIARATQRDDGDAMALQTGRTLTFFVNALIWALAAMFVLSNLGFNISSMIAGLGIGGIAVALAAQAVLGDLFSAVAIWLDRPFEIGDFIIFDEYMGTVEEIGIKTTRVRALSGEALVVPNAALTSAKIRNFKRMTERRVALVIGVAYKTPRALLARLPGLIAEIVRSEKEARLERAHLDKFNDSSIDLELVYWALDPDYTRHMDLKQRILLKVLEAFETEGVEIPFPHRTVYLEKGAA